VLKTPESLGGGLFCGERHRQNRRRVAALSTAVKREVRDLAERLQHIFRTLRHGSILFIAAGGW
jgi:hypothetical protein